MADYNMLAQYTAEGPGAKDLPFNKANWTPTPKQLAVMNTTMHQPYGGDHIVDINDAVTLYNFITGKDPSIVSLGIVDFTYTQPGESSESDNISNFLIIDGHYNKDVNIPFMDFVTDDWVIHEKFFNYLLGMAIHTYSNSEDISYLQKLLKEYYPDHRYDSKFFYPGVYNDNIKLLVKQFQQAHSYYTIGDINRDGVIDKIDLQILRNYLDEHQDTTISDTENYRMDVNEDGVIDELDYQMLEKQVNGEIDTLNKYEVPFMLGWYDVQTEALMEGEINLNENISEVSK